MVSRCVLVVGLLAGGLLLADAQDRPSTQDQNAMLAAMARYAEQYVSNLPNFLCVQTVEQFQGNRKGEHWRKGDTLAMRLAYSDRQEHRTLAAVNDKPLEERKKGWRHPMQTEGEFGPLLANLFSDASAAQFDWDRWEDLNGRRLAVFDYKIDKEHSQAKLGDTYVHDVTVPTYGSVFGDPATGEVFKISSDITDIPSELAQREADTTITYDYVTIGTNKYLLPSHVTVVMKTRDSSLRNESDFRDYKKFEAESTLKFGGDDSGSAPK
jgi:ribosomal protein L39E